MNTFRVLLCGLGLAAPIFSLAAPSQLNGVQSEQTLTIAKGPASRLTDVYTVPEGKKLVLEAGAQIAAEKDGKIVIKGELIVKGDDKAPVLMKGRKWKGIVIETEGKASITGLQITGAMIALEVNGNLPLIQQSVFSRNETGLLVQNSGTTEIDNVLFTEQTGNGCFLSEKNVTVRNCSFIKNKGYGVQISGTSPSFERCYFENNKAGIFLDGDGTSTKGNECNFDSKSIGIESKVSHGSLRFLKCYWGEKSTNQLKSKGVNTNLSNVKDAHDNSGSLKVVLTDFLTAAPQPCGATVKSKL
ncbi:MAG: right-handed parallel beta-helix repeat-containing protein [Puniceicoccales bacterium]|jgi:hypothetical protein|nr:right-handed parallel beta-helix repeat-containing protein [Puniceicoccales bacterium]